MSKFVILENVADERGESSAKVARTLVRLGCDLYLRFGPSREPRTGVNFFPEHPTGGMEHNIGPGDHPLTKDSQEVVIKRLGRGDFTTLGLFVWIYTKVDSSITVPYQIELTKKDESICVVVNPDDVAKLPPLPKSIEGASVQRGGPSAKNNFQISEENYHKNKKSNPELHKIFWRAFVHLRDKDEFPVEPQYKQVWQAIYDDVNNSDIEDSLAEHRKFDPKDIIEKIDSIGITKTTKLFWLFATAGGETLSQGDYSLSSLPSLLNKLKKSPQDIIC